MYKTVKNLSLTALIILAISVTTISLVMSCGGGGGDSTGGSVGPVLASGQFVDAPVKGLSYESGAQKGTTDDQGNFIYEIGNKVKFSLGGIVLGEAPGQSIITPVNLAPAGSSANTAEVVARVQFLMSISSTDPTATGKITIPSNILTMAQGKLLNFTSSTIQTELAAMLISLGITKTLTTQNAAMNHLTTTIYKIYEGAYSGTYTGEETGSWTINIDAQGNVTGNGKSTVYGTTFLVMGTLSTSGSLHFIAGATSTGSTFQGTLDTNGNIQGTWQNAFSKTSGTFSGKKN